MPSPSDDWFAQPSTKLHRHCPSYGVPSSGENSLLRRVARARETGYAIVANETLMGDISGCGDHASVGLE